jgi:hypothetical protein
MSTKPNEDEDERWSEQADEPQFQRVRKQTGKPQTAKGNRRQEEKEWGKAINKANKQRTRSGGKP